MGNEYNVIESAIITCACGGEVTLTSTVPNLKIAGKKPLYLKDILGAPVACPRSINPCTKVASISTAGTEVNVSATGLTYLLRTDGFKTDKGRAVILKNPGQGTSKIAAIPSSENQDVVAEEKALKEENIKIEEEVKTKYELYLLRKSQDIYKPIRPSRAFRKADETYVNNQKESDFDNIYSHTLAFVYLIKNNEYVEYKIYNSGGVNAERVKDIYYHDTKNEVLRRFIPLEEDTSYQVYYSNFQLKSLTDIQKLPKLEINPKTLDKKSGIYIKDIDSIDKNEIEQKLIDAQTPKNGEENSNTIVGFLEDSIGEIEDLYEEYYTNYKLAYTYNSAIFDDIKEKNSYAYTIANLVDYFYVSDFENEEYRKNLFALRDSYKELVKMMFFDKDIYNFILNFKDIENIVHKDTNKRAFSFYKILTNYWERFFDYEFLFYEENSTYMMNKLFFNGDFILLNQSKVFYSTEKNRNMLMQFTGSNIYTLVKKDASEVLAHIVFCLFFLDDFEDKIKNFSGYSKIQKLRNDFIIAYRKIIPLPNIAHSKISNIKSVVEGQNFYNNTVFKQSIVQRDNKNIIKKVFTHNKEKNNHFLEDYTQLDNQHNMKSFDYSYKITFKSNLLYIPSNIQYYKEKGIVSPKIILTNIKTKLEDKKLKNLLFAYKNSNIDKFEFVIGSMNIVYSLCSTKIVLDEEVNVNGIFVNTKIQHLLDFVDDLVYIKTELEDEQKELILGKYKISKYFDEYLIKQLLNELLFQKSSNEAKKKAQAFFDKYQKLANQSPEKQKEEKKEGQSDNGTTEEPLDLDKDIKKLEEEFYTGLKFISGVTDQIDKSLDKFLEEYSNDETYQVKGVSKSRALQLGLAFKGYSSMMAIASMKEYIYDNTNKDIKSTIGFVNDFAGLNSALVGIMQNKEFENMAQAFLNGMDKIRGGKGNIKLNLSNNKLLAGYGNGFAKVSAYAVIIMAILDAIKYKKNEDYDALAVTVGMITLNIVALFVTSGTPLVVFVSLSSIAYAIVMLKFVDSAFESYLKKSLFYNGRIYLGKNRRNQNKYGLGYPAKFLLETTNKKDELKKIESKGFKQPKKIIDFIGENYKTNKLYFDTALNNELSFLQSAMYGYKLDKTDIKTDQRVKNMLGVEVSFRSYEGIKIPSILVDDEKFELYFSPDKVKYIKLSRNNLIEANGYDIFNLFPESESYYDIAQFSSNSNSSNQSSYIIIKSSQIEFKYEVVLRDNDKITQNCDIEIESLEQISFTPEDEKVLEGNKQ